MTNYRLNNHIPGESLRCTEDNPSGLVNNSENMAIIRSLKPGEIMYRTPDDSPNNRRFAAQYYYTTLFSLELGFAIWKIPMSILGAKPFAASIYTLQQTHEKFINEMQEITNEENQQRLLLNSRDNIQTNTPSTNKNPYK